MSGRKIEHLNRIYKDSSKFWEKVKKMIGNTKEKQEYIMDPNRQNVKIYDPADKEIYREIWKKIFSIPPKDNANFDQLNEERVTSHLSNNEDLIKPYQYADLTRLDQNSYLTTPYKTTDVIHIISKFKNKAPGMSGVNKLILSNLPHQAIESFTLFTNLAFSIGSLPAYLSKWTDCVYAQNRQRSAVRTKL